MLNNLFLPIVDPEVLVCAQLIPKVAEHTFLIRRDVESYVKRIILV